MEEYFDIYDGERRNTGRTMARKGYFTNDPNARETGLALVKLQIKANKIRRKE